MAVLANEQWELDGSLVFGEGLPVFVQQSGLDFGSANIRSQDVSRPGGDGLMVGRDYVDGPEIQFEFGVRDSADVWQYVNQLKTAWRPPSRLTPASLSTLRYMRNGVSYRMFGRPRKCDVKGWLMANNTFQTVDATFQLADAMMYRETDQGANTVTLRLIESQNGGGLILPAKVPFIFGAGSQSRAHGVTVDAITPCPFTITVDGPITGTLSGITLGGPGWNITTTTTLTVGDQLVIDTRQQTVQKNGVNIPGALTTGSTLSARLVPGPQVLTFTGIDASNTSSATFSWYDSIPL